MDSTSAEIALEIRRTYAATPTRIFAAWTRAEALIEWFAPSSDMPTFVHHLDVRVGGHFRIEMRAANGTQHIVNGTYLEVSPPHRLRFTWQWEGRDAEETEVSVDLAEQSGGTELVLRHSRFATEASRENHNRGWNGCLGRLPHTLTPE